MLREGKILGTLEKALIPSSSDAQSLTNMHHNMWGKDKQLSEVCVNKRERHHNIFSKYRSQYVSHNDRKRHKDDRDFFVVSRTQQWYLQLWDTNTQAWLVDRQITFVIFMQNFHSNFCGNISVHFSFRSSEAHHTSCQSVCLWLCLVFFSLPNLKSVSSSLQLSVSQAKGLRLWSSCATHPGMTLTRWWGT